jgi:hypothetical protein
LTRSFGGYSFRRIRSLFTVHNNDRPCTFTWQVFPPTSGSPTGFTAAGDKERYLIVYPLFAGHIRLAERPREMAVSDDFSKIEIIHDVEARGSARPFWFDYSDHNHFC